MVKVLVEVVDIVVAVVEGIVKEVVKTVVDIGGSLIKQQEINVIGYRDLIILFYSQFSQYLV